MQRILRLLRWLLALATIAVIAVLCWQAVDIYRTGTANRTDAGVLLQPIYRWEDVAARLTSLAPLLWGYAAFAAAMVALHAFVKPEKARFIPQKALRSTPASQGETRIHKPVRRAKIALYALAIIMVAWGVMNGGLRDVLVKAINICTECIGLG